VRPLPGGGVEVRSGGRTDRYERVVVCAGRCTARFARDLGLTLPVQTAAHVRLTFRVRGPAPRRLATLQDSGGAFGETGIYAAACPGNAEYGLGLSESCPVREDGSLVDPAALAALADRARGYVRRGMPGLDPDPVEVRHCWVTRLPWGDDGVAVWQRDDVLLAAGHNLYKQAPGLGRALAAAVDGGDLDPELHPEAQLGRML
jgi:sarcosine oxidase